MAGRQYLTDPNSPFFAIEEDDVDDETFLRNSRTGNSDYMLSNNSYYQERSALEDKRLQLLERKKAIEDRTIQSSERSISLLRDSEQIGVATAEELLRQREQLERTEKRLDEINTTLRFSQKHIQGIKSVFGSLKNYLSGKSGEQPPAPSLKETDDSSISSGMVASSSPLAGSLDQSRANIGSPTENHPGLKIRGLADDRWDEPSASTASGSQNVNKILDRNLDDMCSSLSRLKGLAQGLGEEIDTQNDVLDRLNDKTDKADFTILRQNKEMAKILKK
ncbi:synaptosomal-associated protein 29 [Periplaneta americana]|uniref:synaptosomal-associated protein 29 n=1 Tax=Periplaneta americana TaxID=6978 RepID=UPI0037E72660